MKITRRKFLKHLAFLVPAVAIAPAAVAKLAAENPQITGNWYCFHTPYTLRGDGIDGDSTLDGSEETLMFDNNPLFSGELGEYSGVTIHRHK